MENSASPQTLSPTPLQNDLPKLNPTTNNGSRNTIHIGGIPVEFPYQPYGSQLAFMNRVISTLDRSGRDGHCHALLESPTGTGKSLSLLCSTLAWQQTQKLKNTRANLTHSSSRPDPRAVSDPINHGGGFIPETQPSENPAAPPPSTNNGKKEKVKLAPTIYYSSRTHAQISQVIREYKKTSYRVPMAVLGSRKHYCTNPQLRGDEKVDEQCKLLMKNKENACPEFKYVHKVKGHPSLQKGGCHEVHDIEDLVKVGQVVKGCSYFAARSMAQEAELVFCPYNYIINPVIREAMEVDISRSIIILDEAHNIEDIARDAGSVNLDEEVLLSLQTELGQLSLNDSMTYQPLFEMIEDILSWIDQRKDALVKRQFQSYFRCWSGDKALKELQEANISLQSFPILQECAKKAIKAASETEPDVSHLSGMSSTTLEGLFSSLNYFFSGKGIHVQDFELALQRCATKNGGWTTTFSLWCLNPAVVFKSIADCSQSVILTSGTLSPLNTFSSELGVQFDTCLEAPHVIDVDSQVWAAAISNGPGNYPLNASYKFADEYAFQDSIGTSLEEICKAAPGGCLVFFPSYKLLDKVSTRWQETGQWSRLNAQKSVFVEPRGSSQESFEDVLKGYYNSIHHGTRQVGGRKIRGKKLGLKGGSLKVSVEDTKIEGAAFLAVCRGKVSEGIDFSDDNARVVVIVGIPFPNIFDVKVERKKKFNDTYETSKNLLSGNEWYCQQAFRALNQATGRCIRHRFDYGAIIFLGFKKFESSLINNVLDSCLDSKTKFKKLFLLHIDERFHKDRNRSYISKWLRKSIRLYGNFEESMDGLRSFFKEVKAHPGISIAANSSQDLEKDCVNIKSVDKKMGATKRNIKTTKSNSCPKKVASDDILVGETAPPCSVKKCSSPFTSKTRNEVVMLKEDKGFGVRQEYIDLDCDSENDSRCRSPPTPMVGLQSDDLELTIVKETPGVCSRGPKITPERNTHHSPTNRITSKTNSVLTEPESGWSVNSNAWKRRKIPDLSSVSHLHDFETPIEIRDRFNSSVTTAEATYRTEESSNHLAKEHLKPHSIHSHAPSGDNTDERLRIFCLSCKSPLGLPENDLLVKSSLISTSKTHLVSLHRKSSESVALSSTSSVDILVSDASLVDQRVVETSGQGIWCKEDGCVYNSIFCPFCVVPENCLGVHVMATDAPNIKFQNKILFYRESLDIKKAEIQNFGAKDEVLSSHGDSHSTIVENKSQNVFEKFAYKSPVQDSGGWRNTRRSRMRLPKVASTQK